MSKLMSEKIVYTEPKLSTSGDNLKKSWFVYFSVTNLITREIKRFQFRGDINFYKTKKERYKEAAPIIAEWKLKLSSGWSPFADVSGNTLVNMRLSEALDFALSKKIVSKKTRSTYNGAVVFFKKSAQHLGLSALPIKTVSRQHIRLILDDIQNRRHKWTWAKTFNKNLGAIKTLFSVLVEWEIIEQNPAFKIKTMPETETNKYKPYTEEEKKQIREHLYLHHYGFFTMLMITFHTGIRPKEVLALKIKDVDLRTATITIQPSPEAENSKTKKIRVVPINAHLMPFFREMRLQDYTGNKFVFGSPFPPGQGNRGSTKEGRGVEHPLYFTPSSTQISRDTVTKFWNKVVMKKLGIKKYMYAMKHTGANEKILAGIDLDALRELYGHSSKLMTEKYAKVVKEVYRKQIMEKSPEF